MDFSDDQLAVVGAFAALAICGVIAALTFHFGPAGKFSQDGQSGRALPFPATSSDKSAKDDRKAA